MRNLVLFFLIVFSLWGCKKDGFDVDNPDVEEFVSLILSETYTEYEVDKNGEKLWLKMPKFTKSHIDDLLNFAEDTTHILVFPLNPLASMLSFPNDREYLVLGECLLWAIEGVRNETGYGSLTPFLIDKTKPEGENSLNGKEILSVRERYRSWWDANRSGEWKSINPLEGTIYQWH